MSVIKTLCFLVLLMSAELLYAVSAEKNKVVSIQEEILLELAAQDIAESYQVLGKFYTERAEASKTLKQKVHWSIKAAQLGNKKSLYMLAKYSLNFAQNKKQFAGSYIKQADIEGKLHKESLALIGVAAILGFSHAKTDLVMLPKLMPISYHEIEIAVQEALSRLNHGDFINCTIFVCTEKLRNNGQISLLKYQQAAQLFNLQRKQLHCHPLKQCLEEMLTGINYLTESKVRKYTQTAAAENSPKILKNLRLHQQSLAKSSASWDQKSNDDRNDKRIQSAIRIVAHHANEDRNKLKTRISELLEKINYHRDKDNQVTLAEIMQILAQP